MSDTVSDQARDAAWQALAAEREALGATHMRDLFHADSARGERMSLEAAGLALEYSRNIATQETMSLLAQLAAAAGVESRRDAMFGGAHINHTARSSV